ncbi:MAG: M20/M25/M40 family metallo-hydrolase [Spirochaetaceae bacterium]|nr:M20/M25/M40 family metallo-hydrolase [Spirochaetaceae bacterium]
MSHPSINRKRLVETLIELCRIPSPSGHEEELKLRVRERLNSMGYDSAIDDFGNLYTATEATSLEDMFISCHLDTVPIPEGEALSVIRQNGRISSGGNTILGGDDKLGVAAALEMLAMCREHPDLHRGLDIIFTVQEELGSLGGGVVEPQRLRARNGFNLDGETPPGSVIYQAPRKARFSCSVHGTSAHAALAPEDGVNAVVIAGTIVSRLPLGIPGPESTSNIGSISGGTQTNIVPDHAEFIGELRSFSDEEFRSVKSDIDRICRETAREMNGSAEIIWESTYEGYRVSSDEPITHWFTTACETRGIQPVFLTSRGGGDSNQLNARGLSNLVFGLGMNNIHTSNEFVVEDEYVEAVELLKTIVFPGLI